MKQQQAVIVSAVRTPLGSFNGVFCAVPATRLGSVVIAEALKRINLSPERVEDVYMGCVLSGDSDRPPRGKRRSAPASPIRLVLRP